MKKYEYKMLTVSVAHFRKESFRAELDAKFNAWGDDGWELIKMEPITKGNFFTHGSTTEDFLIVFKREKGDR